MQEQHTLFLDAETVSEQRKHMVLAPPAVEPLHEVFAEAMLEDTSAHQRRSPFDWIASIGVHFAVLAVLLVLPLYFTAGLDSHRLNLTFLAPPAMPAGPPPPPMISSAVQHPPRVPVARMFNAGKLTAPSFIPKAVVVTPGEAAAPPDDAFAGVPGGVPGGQVGGVLGGILGGLPKGAPPAAPVAAPSGPKEPVRVGGLVKQPKLLFAPDADYPTLARQARLSGVVLSKR